MSRDRGDRIDARQMSRDSIVSKTTDQTEQSSQPSYTQFGAEINTETRQQENKPMGHLIKTIITTVKAAPIPKPAKWLLLVLLFIALGAASFYGYAAALM